MLFSVRVPVFLAAALLAGTALATDNNLPVTIAEPPPVAVESTPVDPIEPAETAAPAAPTNTGGAAAVSDNLAAEDTPPTDDPDDRPAPNTVILQGLNKVTGRISRLEAPLGTVMRFGKIELIARRCWRSPVDERPENAGLIEVWEMKPGESPQQIFLGWIFSSSPGLSGLEHPVYDITILSCEFFADPETHITDDAHDKPKADTEKKPEAKTTPDKEKDAKKPKAKTP
jgi:hypothetical protein